MSDASVSVVMAAFDASETLGRAVTSALAEPQTAEVLVIDDASRDATRDVALALAASDPRVRLIALATNGGPARARNAGLDAARAPWIAMLDADDLFLPGRLARLCALTDCDLAADDVAFVRDDLRAAPGQDLFGDGGEVSRIGLADFARGNIGGRRRRGELGFLKPIMSRELLDRHGLRYDETLRLGEDVDLYLRALVHGGRFAILRRVGYCATVRDGSLSAAHGADDLASLHAALLRQAAAMAEDAPGRAAILELAATLRRRRDHRRFLDRKARDGLSSAIRFAFAAPGRAGPIALDVLRDKLRRSPQQVIPPGAAFRTLLGDQEAGTTSSTGGSAAASGRASPGRSSTRIRRAPGR
ncbi:MAG: glycosyltransferase family 2 protein [Roseicyclus sp.]